MLYSFCGVLLADVFTHVNETNRFKLYLHYDKVCKPMSALTDIKTQSEDG
jgi:hypothetical protein